MNYQCSVWVVVQAFFFLVFCVCFCFLLSCFLSFISPKEVTLGFYMRLDEKRIISILGLMAPLSGGEIIDMLVWDMYSAKDRRYFLDIHYLLPLGEIVGIELILGIVLSIRKV